MGLTQEQLKKLLRYDPDTGIFTWLVRRGTACAGETAGGTDNKGYIKIAISYVYYRAHRLAWLYMTGEWPTDQIDHINGIKHDNRWSNLREADRFINQQNKRKPPTHNVSGFLGVCVWGDRFRAQITSRGKSHYLGTYHTAEQAHEAYLHAKRRLHEGCTI